MLLLSGCGLGLVDSLSQGSGLPPLIHLDWGFPAYNRSVYSPDGRWIATLAGADVAGGHLEVVSPNGQTRYDLTSWNCGQLELFDFAWLPDGRLACITGSEPPYQMCLGAAPFQQCTVIPLPDNIDASGDGATWAPDGSFLIFSGFVDPVPVDHLLAVSAEGALLADFAPPDEDGLRQPAWVPTTNMISYWSTSGLMLSTLTRKGQKLVLGPPKALIPGYAGLPYVWSPTGTWAAVRYGDYRGGDKIYLMNRLHPTQTVDIVLADRAGQQMDAPIWSPDGRTLIVFGVNDNQPYAIDIAAYLQSKGLAE